MTEMVQLRQRYKVVRVTTDQPSQIAGHKNLRRSEIEPHTPRQSASPALAFNFFETSDESVTLTGWILRAFLIGKGKVTVTLQMLSCPRKNAIASIIKITSMQPRPTGLDFRLLIIKTSTKRNVIDLLFVRSSAILEKKPRRCCAFRPVAAFHGPLIRLCTKNLTQ